MATMIKTLAYIYNDVKDRVKTFDKYIKNNKLKLHQKLIYRFQTLADAGFIYFGLDDAVECVYCGAKFFDLENIRNPQDPSRHSPDGCIFYNNDWRKEVLKERLVLLIKDEINCWNPVINNKLKSSVLFRFESFSHIRGDPNHPHELLAQYGMYNISSEKRVLKCISCDYVTYTLLPYENMLRKHLQDSPKCSYSLSLLHEHKKQLKSANPYYLLNNPHTYGFQDLEVSQRTLFNLLRSIILSNNNNPVSLDSRELGREYSKSLSDPKAFNERVKMMNKILCHKVKVSKYVIPDDDERNFPIDDSNGDDDELTDEQVDSNRLWNNIQETPSDDGSAWADAIMAASSATGSGTTEGSDITYNINEDSNGSTNSIASDASTISIVSDDNMDNIIAYNTRSNTRDYYGVLHLSPEQMNENN